MKRLLLCAVSLTGLGLAAWSSHSGQARVENEKPTSVRHDFGAIHPRIAASGREIVFSYQGAIWRVPREGPTRSHYRRSFPAQAGRSYRTNRCRSRSA